jgi:hypothetical protein
MNLDVLLSSGEVDNWEEVEDAIEGPAGQLVVVSEIEGDEVPDGVKTMVLKEEIEQGWVQPDGSPAELGKIQVPAPPMVKSRTVEVLAVYAPGMWMRVVFNP